MKRELEAGKSEDFIEAPVSTGAAHSWKYSGRASVGQLRKDQSPVVRVGAKFCSLTATLTWHFSPRDTPRITLAQMVRTLHNPVNLTLKIDHHRYVIFPLACKDLGSSFERSFFSIYS